MWLWISVAGNILLLVVVLYSWFDLLRYVGQILRLRKANRRLRKIVGAGAIGSMKPVNRSVAVIRPRPPCLEWINEVQDSAEKKTLEDLRGSCAGYLLPVYGTEDEAMKFIRRKHQQIFEDRLQDWYIDESRWPKRRNYRMFLEWFHIELHSEVIDMATGIIFKGFD